MQEALDNAGLAILLGGALLLAGLLAVRFHWRAVLVTAVTVRWRWPRPVWCCSYSVKG